MISKNNPRIIVCGNQKSGTTAIGELLARASGLSKNIEIVARSGDFTDPIKLDNEAAFQKLLESHSDAVRVELIECSQFTWIPEWIEDIWPHATLVFVIRDPRATIRSQLDRINHAGDKAEFDPKGCYRFTPSWENIVTGKLLGCEREHYISTLAARWSVAARKYLERQNRSVLIRYEDFCRDKTGSIYDLAECCEVEPHEDISGMVNRQWQPKGDNRGCDWHEFFGKENLQRIERECNGEMQLLGYQAIGARNG